MIAAILTAAIIVGFAGIVLAAMFHPAWLLLTIAALIFFAAG